MGEAQLTKTDALEALSWATSRFRVEEHGGDLSLQRRSRDEDDDMGGWCLSVRAEA